MLKSRAISLSLVVALLVVALTSSVSATAHVPHPSIVDPHSALQQPGSVQRDVTYCVAGGVELKMDVYYPRLEPGKLAPAVVYVHGGGWVAGDKSEVGQFAGPVVASGYLIASINYRLAPQHLWPAQIEDTKCAVRHLRANAAKYRLDSARIGIWGASAGGHLAALAGLARSDAGFEGGGGYPEQSSEVAAVIDMFGPTDLGPPYDRTFPVDLIESLVGKRAEQAVEELRRASPVTYVRGDAPPFLILHGDMDRVVPLSQSESLHAKLTAAGAKSNLVVVKNAGHAFIPAGGAISPGVFELGGIIIDFLNTNVRDAASASRTFAETGKTARGPFLRYWERNGGLAQQGFPISEEMQEVSETDGKSYTVQYFERAVFELHPENAGKSSEVLLSLLGVFRYNAKYPASAPGQVPNNTAGSVLFAETGKRVGGKFLEYWQKNGGLAQQGFPISEEFTEVSDLDGKPYLVQYFERAVFEYHPENAPPNDVLLSQLGTFRYREKYVRNGGQR